MACCGDSYEKQLLKNIKTKIRVQQNRVKHEFKLLLLGTGESGKSTILKGMQMIYGKEFEKEAYRREFTEMVFQNLLAILRLVHDAGVRLGAPITDAALEGKVAELKTVRDAEFKAISPDVLQTFQQFWADKDVQGLLAAHRGDFYLPDSTDYFYGRLEAIGTAGYLPTRDDILRVRKATTGIHEYVFDINYQDIQFRMIDVGGQQSERKKWIHCFENVQTIIFIVSSSEYDMVLAEDGTSNRMQESIALFDHIVQYQWFKNTSFVLFLNKKDLLEKKIAEKPFSDTFPNFVADMALDAMAQDGDPGVKSKGKTVATQALDYIGKMYTDKADTVDHRGVTVAGAERVYVHHTCATSIDLIEVLFDKIKIDIMKDALRTYNLIR